MVIEEMVTSKMYIEMVFRVIEDMVQSKMYIEMVQSKIYWIDTLDCELLQLHHKEIKILSENLYFGKLKIERMYNSSKIAVFVILDNYSN